MVHREGAGAPGNSRIRYFGIRLSALRGPKAALDQAADGLRPRDLSFNRKTVNGLNHACIETHADKLAAAGGRAPTLFLFNGY
jgi:hypothetical protein